MPDQKNIVLQSIYLRILHPHEFLLRKTPPLVSHRKENNIALICNPLAGKGRALRVANHLAGKLRRRSWHFTFYSTDWPTSLEGFTAVWLAGGDGTVHEFINRYPATSVPVALFKAGSGNDFAWKLYGDLSPEEYFDIAMKGLCKKIDAGVCNGRYFINGVGIGFDGSVVKTMGSRKHLTAGHLSYLAVVLRNIFIFREQEMVISTEGWQREGSFFMLAIANGPRYGGGFQVAPRAEIDDQFLDLVLIRPIGLWKRFRYLPLIKKGEHLHLPFIESHRLRKITIQSPVILPAHLDGELMESDRFEIGLSAHPFLFVC